MTRDRTPLLNFAQWLQMADLLHQWEQLEQLEQWDEETLRPLLQELMEQINSGLFDLYP